jgi:hypothetical protein
MISRIIIAGSLIIPSLNAMENEQKNVAPIQLTAEKTKEVLTQLDNLIEKTHSDFTLLFPEYVNRANNVHIQFEGNYWTYIKSVVTEAEWKAITILRACTVSTEGYNIIFKTILSDKLFEQTEQLRREHVIRQKLATMQAYNLSALCKALDEYLAENPWIAQLQGIQQNTHERKQ